MSEDGTPTCPECGRETAQKALKGRGQVIVGCPKHGLIDDWSDEQPRLLSCRGAYGGMDPEERAWLLVRGFQAFLGNPEHGEYILIEDVSRPDEYVQFEHHDGILYAEVGSREWDCAQCGNVPLGADAVWALSLAGFLAGGRRRNYSKDGVTDSPLRLAALAR